MPPTISLNPAWWREEFFDRMSRNYDYQRLIVQRLPDGGILVRFKSRKLLSDSEISQIRKELRELVAPERLMLVDLTSVEYLSSGAIAALLTTQRLLRKLAGNMTLCGLRPEIDKVFRICKLHRTFDIYPNLESALGASSAGT